MIITEQKTIARIIDSLKNYERIFLVGCGECATTCKTGGREELLQMQKALESQGKQIVGSCIPGAPCLAPQIKIELAKNSLALRQAQAILVLACGLGVQAVKDNNRLAHPVFPACDSLCGAVMDAQGNFLEKCSMCGECVLASTGGICPMTLCPKSLLNGPCGGMNKGKCEVNQEQDCAWTLIYKEMDKQQRLSVLRKISVPKDFQKTLKPHQVNMGK